MKYATSEIRQDSTLKKPRYYCVITRTPVYDAKIVYGGSPEIVKRKVEKALKAIKKNASSAYT